MPGIYLGAILFSLAGMIAIDWKFGLALRTAPRRTVVAVGLGTVFFLAWDAVGILTGVFVKGDSPLFVGLDLAPHLPVEEGHHLGHRLDKCDFRAKRSVDLLRRELREE